MEIEIHLEIQQSVTLNIKDHLMEVIMQRYHGDIEKWAKEEAADIIDTSNLDIEVDSCSFSKKEAEDVLKEAAKRLGYTDDFEIIKNVRHRTILSRRECDIPTVDDEIEEFLVDIKLLSKAINYVDINNPKYELDYIYLDGTDIVATDTKRLIRLQNHEYSYKKVLFPAYFVEPIKDGAECFINNCGELLLKYKKVWYMGWEHNFNNYPDYKRILLDAESLENNKYFNIEFSPVKTQTPVKKESIKCDLLELIFDSNNRGYINYKYFNEILENDFKINTIYRPLNTDDILFHPIHFVGEDIEVIIMPVEVKE